MNVAMLSNLYLPHVGGVQRSIGSFSAGLRAAGHRVLIVAPLVEREPVEEPDLVLVPAIQNFNGSDFAVALPVPGLLTETFDEFAPDIIHAHHPFLLGDTALRVATARELPLVFTYHTMWEHYTHYVPSDSEAVRRFVILMAAEYANLCDHVIAPSNGVRDTLLARGVSSPISVIPTGIDPAVFAWGDGQRVRRQLGIPQDEFVVGHLGRLSPEKNLEFLARAVARFLSRQPGARFLVVGTGPEQAPMTEILNASGVAPRVHWAGLLTGDQDLSSAYHAMDLLAFSSHSETQGMVLAEAATAGLPIVALAATGVDDIVEEGVNGAVIADEDEEAFAAALQRIATMPPAQRTALAEASRQAARRFAQAECVARLLELYTALTARQPAPRSDDNAWRQSLRMVENEWRLWSTRAAAAVKSLGAA